MSESQFKKSKSQLKIKKYIRNILFSKVLENKKEGNKNKGK